MVQKQKFETMNKLLLLSIVFINFVNSLTFVKFPLTYIPLIDFSNVYLRDLLDCDQHLRPMRDQCEYYYIKAVNETKLRHRMDINTESFRKAVCCDSWQLKACVAKAAEDIPECGSEVAKRFVIMTNDKVVMKEVLDNCSEYGENPPICDFDNKPATNLFNSVILSVIIFLLSFFLIVSLLFLILFFW